jgi:septum formation protein
MPGEPSLWRGGAPLLLASTSPTRRGLLANAGLPVETEAPGVDERAIEIAAGANDARHLAQRLAREKALAVSGRHPERVVLGADQTLSCEGRLFHKPADRTAAERQLAALSGRTHVLNSAFAIAQQGTVLHEGCKSARLGMRALSADDIDLYLHLAGEAALQSVGAYQVEGLGIHLFAHIEGDHATILGLPLLALLARLREMGLLAF